MLGNAWHATLIGMTDLERRHELGLAARLRRQAQGWKPGRTARLQAWIGGQLIRAGEALRRAELSDQGKHPVLEASAADLWRTYPSRV